MKEPQKQRGRYGNHIDSNVHELVGDVHDESEIYIDRKFGMKNTKSKVQLADG